MFIQNFVYVKSKYVFSMVWDRREHFITLELSWMSNYIHENSSSSISLSLMLLSAKNVPSYLYYYLLRFKNLCHFSFRFPHLQHFLFMEVFIVRLKVWFHLDDIGMLRRFEFLMLKTNKFSILIRSQIFVVFVLWCNQMFTHA